ncbi:hypothetical protein [Mumia zhuanghuii]|uniref:Uncharacterized protein n=1 Tax=Mumia zhuanghuii TaxID=2585211 RepID=A0A5C4MT79_9ACTN|nr:hypothetical protein [Mumia zhuanghuii]TNC47364.1 hypothetical protein FHE65_10130 [Mumia zhuanghuii]TNC47657.1 hypothetical protein FHE65_09235 [Mumia zhuanghuii]
MIADVQRPPAIRTSSAKLTATVVPVALLVYAACRWLDGRDHHHGPGLWWTVGHLAFLASWVAFAALTVGMVTALRRTPRVVAWGTGAATLAGIGAFTWVTLTDLFPSWPDLPEVLRMVGPLLFLVGLMALLGMTARSQQMRWWPVFPLLALAATVVVSANLDLLPVSAVLFGAALVPCRRPARMQSS